MASDDARSAAIHVRRFFAACALGCVSLSPAYASWSAASTLSKSAPYVAYNARNRAVLESNPALARNAMARAYGLDAGGVKVSDTLKVALGGAVIDVVASKVVPPSAYPYIAGGALALAGGYAAGTALREYLTANNLDIDESGNPIEWVGGQTVTNYRYQWSYQGTFSRGTIGAARDAIAAAWIQQLSNAGWNPSLTSKSCSPSGSYYVCTFNATTSAYGPQDLSVQVSKIADTWCMDSNGQLTIRPTAGLCPQGTQQPFNPSNLPTKLINPPPNPGGVVEEGLGLGVPDIPAGQPSVTGPSSVPGPTTTTTGPAGTTVTNVTNNYNYDNDTITVTQTTTVNHPNGDVETTVTEDVPQPSECEKNPDTLGCTQLDEVDPGEIPKDTENITFQAEDVFGGGQCPANVQASFATIAKSATIVDWQTFCGHALPLRALVIGLASIMAMFIIMPGGKVE